MTQLPSASRTLDAPLVLPAPALPRLRRATWALLIALGALLLLRLAAMAWLPLMDTTEARYAEIGRKMLALNDWITPWHDNGVPFWGKPPLSFWLTALSMKLFGVNAFAARLPHFACMVAIAFSVHRLARSRDGLPALAGAAILAGAALPLAAAGAVMTDAALVLGTTLAMRGIWLALHGPREGVAAEQRRIVAGLVIGLLAKGPLALVLVALPVGAWALWTRRPRHLLTALPWPTIAATTLLAAGTWYLAAELKTPGFLAYFIVGEHWHRFVTPGWSGDLYGFAHAYPCGTIWLFAAVAVLPWPLVLGAIALWRRRPAVQAAARPAHDDASWAAYLLCWALAPLLFFSAAHNIILPYVLPALPPLALLATHWLARRTGPDGVDGAVAAGLGLTLLLLLGAGLPAWWSGRPDAHSARNVVAAWQAYRHAGEPLVIITERQHSADFYSRGQARFADTPADALQKLDRRGGFVVLRSDDAGPLAQLACASRRIAVGPFVLLRIPPACPLPQATLPAAVTHANPSRQQGLPPRLSSAG